MDQKDDNILGVIQGIFNSPIAQGMIQAQQQAETNRQFNEKFKKYEENRFTLTDEEKDKLVLAVGSGKDSYKNICEVLPEMNPSTLMQYLLDDPPREPQTANYFNHIPRFSVQRLPSLVQFIDVPEDFQELYQFKDTDRFHLTVTGENMLYYLKKELVIKQEAAKQELIAAQRHEEQMRLQRKVFIASIVAIIIGVVQLLK